ncbi:MAG: hypothetical protein UY48_C0028G0008 [Candidatus Gottesmanbacteria bacterium GW2011_GWB1_49_7]|uniref:Uncharacterized protein n=1 Tax=Candidatus Gottesmanbacteria bacterium GW2011_GWB1_49_7 TaxID=1618448 RepID=A0A0G1YX13_9BACT|nr:MAG: hypothetical protein UY48_C0028G0008 [Candidatus Gottesmanbacteria bacterium GW2011_GWB1_49_7]
MKRLGIIVGIFGTIAFLVAFFVSRRTQISKEGPIVQPTISPIVSPLPQPSFPADPMVPSPSYTLGAIADTFPRSLPVFTAQPVANEQVEVQRIAAVLGIQSPPAVDRAPEGAYYMWSTSPGLFIGPGTQHVDYSAVAPTNTPLASPDNTFVSAGMGLATRVLQWYQLKLTSTLYFAPQVTDLNFVPRQSATAIQLIFTPQLSGLPLIAGNPTTSGITIRYNASQSLLYFSGYTYPKFVASGATPIISLEDAGRRLLSNQGTILSLSSAADINAHDTKWYQFSLATVSRADLAYYYDFAKKQLSPVFLFTGAAIDKTTGKQVDTTTAVSAVP